MRKYWHIILPCFVWVGACLDLASTLVVINLDDRFYEANPIVQYGFEKYGQVNTSIFKLMGTAIQCLAIWWILRGKNKFLKYFIGIGVLVPYALLGIWWIICWTIFLFY